LAFSWYDAEASSEWIARDALATIGQHFRINDERDIAQCERSNNDVELAASAVQARAKPGATNHDARNLAQCKLLCRETHHHQP
jgi:hypothetical protein